MTDERIDEFLNAVSRIAQEWDGEIYGLPRHNLPRVEMRAQTRTLLDAALRSSTRKSADEGQAEQAVASQTTGAQE